MHIVKIINQNVDPVFLDQNSIEVLQCHGLGEYLEISMC
jgi:hypothetical protein